MHILKNYVFLSYFLIMAFNIDAIALSCLQLWLNNKKNWEFFLCVVAKSRERKALNSDMKRGKDIPEIKTWIRYSLQIFLQQLSRMSSFHFSFRFLSYFCCPPNFSSPVYNVSLIYASVRFFSITFSHFNHFAFSRNLSNILTVFFLLFNWYS